MIWLVAVPMWLPKGQSVWGMCSIRGMPHSKSRVCTARDIMVKKHRLKKHKLLRRLDVAMPSVLLLLLPTAAVLQVEGHWC